MQSRNDQNQNQNQNRGNDERGSHQELQAAAGQDKNTKEHGNYGMRDDHRHYDNSQQGSGYAGGAQNSPSGSQYQGSQQNSQGGSQGYRGGSFDTSQGRQYSDPSSHQSRQGANMNLGMDNSNPYQGASSQSQNYSSGYGGSGYGAGQGGQGASDSSSSGSMGFFNRLCG